MQNADVKRVIVVSKTHLDVGFTDYAQSVLDRYVNVFIPDAVELAFSVNTPDSKRFVWTVGSYLIRYYLAHAQQTAKARLIEALRLGYVRYHALPLTTHTELMNAELFTYGLSIAKDLDARFGQHTVAAKLTDVPGHTAAMVPLLAEAGITYLHIGVNTGSRVPNVPPLFVWRYGDASLIVNYTGGYGEATVLDTGVALEFLHTLDNSGPPKRSDLDRFYAEMAEKYPNASVSAGSLDAFAAEVVRVSDRLPVVDEEIGDTWIHGVASDPLKTARYRRLLGLTETWLDEGRLSRDSAAYDACMENLLLVAEHTWGMDVKKHLLDFSNWSKPAFSRALAADRTDYASYGPHNRHIFERVADELHEYRGDKSDSSYTHFLRSHLEQRAYVERALAALPVDCRAEAEAELNWTFPEPSGEACPFGEPVVVGAWRVLVGTDGALRHVHNDALGIDRDVCIGGFSYDSFSGRTVDACFFDYGRDLKENFAWAECDFGKPALRYEASVCDGLWGVNAQELRRSGDTLTVFMRGDAEAAERYGCPRELALEYRFTDDEIRFTLYWRGKDPVRSPEALWLAVELGVSNPCGWRLAKLGRPICPLNVVSGGNRKLHCAERLQYQDALCSASIESFDAPLVSVGARSLYRVDDRVDDPRNGFYFLLCNNRWGTNFPQWFGEDMRFGFRIRLAALKPAVGVRG